jgi:hypothetical protein
MEASNVIEHRTAKLADLKKWHDKEQAHQSGVRECWPHIARRMFELREECPSDNEFGSMLTKHGIEYNSHDRAAFVWMGSLKPAVLEDAMANCTRRSPRTFRVEVESWNDDYFKPVWQNAKPEILQAEVPEIPEIEVEERENVEVTPASSVDFSTEQVGGPVPEPVIEPVTAKVAPNEYRKIINEHFTNPVTQTELVRESFVKRAGVSGALAELIASGALGGPTKVKVDKFSCRLIIEDAPRGFFDDEDAGHCRGSKNMHESAMKILENAQMYLRMREELQAAGKYTPKGCHLWWHENVKQPEAVRRRQEREAEQPASPPVVAPVASESHATFSPTKSPMPESEGSEIIVCGQVIWPNARGEYTWREAWYALMHYKEINALAAAAPGSEEGRARHLYSIAGMYGAGYIPDSGIRAFRSIALAHWRHGAGGFTSKHAPLDHFSK